MNEKVTFKDVLVMVAFVAYYAIHSRLTKWLSFIGFVYFAVMPSLDSNLMFTSHPVTWFFVSLFVFIFSSTSTGYFSLGKVKIDLNRNKHNKQNS